MKLIKQGAEARVFEGDFYGHPCLIKERFKKNYRHSVLDKNLTTQRLKSEVRANLRCRMAGKKCWSYIISLFLAIYVFTVNN